MVTAPPRRTLVAALLVAGALVHAACEREGAESPGRESKLVVFAAASLREPFTKLGDAFEKSHPNVEVAFNFAGSQELGTQIEHGAAVDVFAPADRQHMNELVRANEATAPALFARNEPVMIVAKHDADALEAFADLPKARRIVLGAPEVPIGRYTLQILDRASTNPPNDFRSRVEARVVSRELNVRQVLAKVTLGEADAAIVYRTDAATAKDRVAVVAIPPELNVIAEYPIATVTAARNPELARAWIGVVLSEAGRKVLADAGFLPPAPSGTRP
jgi:molybdate transport system substrate-binding protein